MNRPTISRRKSSHEVEVERHNVFYYTELEAFVAGTKLVEAIGTSGGVISSREDAVATRGIRSFGNGGMCGSPYVFQR